MSKEQASSVEASLEDEETSEELRAKLEAEYAQDASEDDESDEGTSEDTQEDEDEASDGEVTESKSQEKPPIMGRWNTADEVVTSYKHLESEFASTRAELNRLKSKGQSDDKPDLNVKNAEFARIVADEKNPYGAVQRVAREEVARVEEKIAHMNFSAALGQWQANPEFAALEPTMAKIVTDNHELIERSGLKYKPELIPILFFMAKGMTAEEKARAAEERGKEKGKANAKRKVKAMTEGSSATKGISKKDPYKMDMKELKARIERGERD